MRSSNQISATIGPETREAGQGADDHGQAAQGPIPEPVSAAETALPRPADSPEAAQGRRTFSTAFVMVGPDGHLTVELRDGRVLVLRDVIMRAADYCGMRVPGSPKARYCGDYADVAAARPGGAQAADGSNSAADLGEPVSIPYER